MKSPINKFLILPGILLVPVLLMAVDPHEYTDYIDGKWYQCKSWVVDAAGDTVYYRDLDGNREYYKYDDQHHKVYRTNQDREECFYTYTATGKELTSKCSDGTFVEYFYDKLDRLVRIKSRKNTVSFDYDGDTDRGIHFQKVDTLGNILDESWYEYDDKKNETKWITRTGKVTIYHPIDGPTMYQKQSDGFEIWFDDKGNIIKDKEPNGKITQYKNKYDSKGRIIYKANDDQWFRYFTKKDTSYKCWVDGKY